MINLIKNELKKISKKKVLYIMFIVTLVFMILINILQKKFQNSFDSYSEEQVSFYKEQLENVTEESNPDFYADCKSIVDASELVNKYGLDSWQRYIIESKLQSMMKEMIRTKSGAEYDELKKQYDQIVENLEKGNWQTFANEELEKIESELATVGNSEIERDNLEDAKQVVQWRIEKDIPYGKSVLNSYLETWYESRVLVRQFNEKNNPSHNDKMENQKNIATAEICKYAIENRINTKISNQGNSSLKYSMQTNAKTELLNVFDGYELFIIITIVIIAGTMISEEFNKGTIKLLLVRPYSRIKILCAKFFTCLIILIVTLMTVAIMQTVIGGIIYGFDSYGAKTVIYSFNTNALSTINMFGYMVLLALAKLPKLVLLMTLAFSLSTIFTNSPIAIAIPLLGTMVESIINQLAYTYDKAKFLIYFVTPNWDFSQYLFGCLPNMKSLTLQFSISVCIVYFVVLIGLSLINFKKKNIKNI